MYFKNYSDIKVEELYNGLDIVPKISAKIGSGTNGAQRAAENSFKLFKSF